MNVDLAAQSALGDGTDTLSSIENASGSNFADQLFGNGGPNTLQGRRRQRPARRRRRRRRARRAGWATTRSTPRTGCVDTIVCGGGQRHARRVDSIDVVNADCEAAGFLGGPLVRTIEASGITTTGATLNGGVNPDGRAVNYRFRYGPTSAYGTTTPSAPLPASHTESLVSAAISGLTPGATYHFQLVVTDNFGNKTRGTDQSFTTGSVAAQRPGRDDAAGHRGRPAAGRRDPAR